MDLSLRRSPARRPADRLRELRLAAGGFTLVELLVVLVVIGILITIAVPAYSALTKRAELKTAEQQIRAAMPAAQAFFLDNDTYVGLGNGVKKNPPGISSYDRALEIKVGTGKGAPTATTYCLNATVGNTTVSARGPGPAAWYQKVNCKGTSSATAP